MDYQNFTNLLIQIIVRLGYSFFEVNLAKRCQSGPFGFRSKLPIGSPRTLWRLHTVPFISKHQAGKVRIPTFRVFGKYVSLEKK